MEHVDQVDVPGSGWANKDFRGLCKTSENLFAGDEEDENKVPVGLATLAKAYDWKGKPSSVYSFDCYII